SFLTLPNIQYYNYLMLFYKEPPLTTPIVFTPCGRADKSRGAKGRSKKGDFRKYISESMTHDFMKAITKNILFEIISLTEPLTAQPYSLEKHPLRPDYELPEKDLSVQEEWLFIYHLSLFLAKLKLKQPDRKALFYIGGAHHYFILYYANDLLGSPFKIVQEIPKGGIRGYAKAADEFKVVIEEYMKTGIIPEREKSTLEDYKKRRNRGRYSNLPFITSLEVYEYSKNEGLQEKKIGVCEKDAYIKGFDYLYDLHGPEAIVSPETILDFFT
ncbi:MAG: hypothetical protein ACFFD4_39370, partial [Candidatus Odinarchaeota archaeon]